VLSRHRRSPQSGRGGSHIGMSGTMYLRPPAVRNCPFAAQIFALGRADISACQRRMFVISSSGSAQPARHGTRRPVLLGSADDGRKSLGHLQPDRAAGR
jgi:hypothetical protein